MTSETTPLVSSRKDDEDVDYMPNGAVAEEFNPRPVFGRGINNNKYGGGPPPPGPPPPSSTWTTRDGLHNRHHRMKQPSVGGGFIDYVVDSLKPSFAPPPTAPTGPGDVGIGTLLIPRKAPIKVEPKVHLANERTFLAWLSIITILTSASGLILAYGDDGEIATQLYGLVLLPVSVAFLFYTLWKYVRRSQMIKNRQPGPFVDYVGPVTITTILIVTIIAQFTMKMHSLHHHKYK
ncbi:hypothetical protein ACHAXA_009207 [Cyclostephanos tholiformis]|uniref:DUF202 domain-containing protein n=1 Tax=Cyclostephanos tholiformis TaxID=382380 RepID=A0ABD3RFR1_9STRA